MPACEPFCTLNTVCINLSVIFLPQSFSLFPNLLSISQNIADIIEKHGKEYYLVYQNTNKIWHPINHLRTPEVYFVTFFRCADPQVGGHCLMAAEYWK